METGLIIRLVLSAVAVVFCGRYQYECAVTEMQRADTAWVIIKRIAIFLSISLIVVLIIFSAGGGETLDDVAPRRWEDGRG